MRKRTRMSAKTPQEERETAAARSQRTDRSQPPHAAVDYIRPLQTTVGNRVVQRWLKSGIIQPTRRVGQPQQADRVLRTPGLRQAEPEQTEAHNRSQPQLLASQTTSLIQPQNGDALEARKLRGQEMAKDIIWAIKLIREVYLRKYGSLSPMTIVLHNTIKRRKGPWDQYLTIDDVKQNYGKSDVRYVSYMEKTLIDTTRYGLVNGWTFTQIADSWNRIWVEAVQAVAYVRKGLQQYDVSYRPMVKWMLGRRYKDSVLFYLVTPEPGFWKKMWRWLTSQSP